MLENSFNQKTSGREKFKLSFKNFLNNRRFQSEGFIFLT